VPCRVVCISHATGAGGVEVGRLVAERLGFLYVDEEIVAKAAVQAGLEPGDVADEERRRSFAARILNSIADGGSGAIALGGAVPVTGGDEPSGAVIRALIRETIEQTAARGDVVIGAHAASQALEAGADVRRVFVTASPSTRARRLCGERGIDEDQAVRAVNDEDAGRRDYLKRFYRIERELPTHYDLVINTDILSLDEAAKLITQSVSNTPSSAATEAD
jgi:uncharacterized protein